MRKAAVLMAFCLTLVFFLAGCEKLGDQPKPIPKPSATAPNSGTLAKCPCDPCDCKACSCDRLKAADVSNVEWLPVVYQEPVGQRSRPNEDLLNMSGLAKVLQDFSRQLFGGDGKPGLKDDIAAGLKEWSNTFKMAAITAGLAHFGLLAWIGYSLHRLAEAKAAA